MIYLKITEWAGFVTTPMPLMTKPAPAFLKSKKWQNCPLCELYCTSKNVRYILLDLAPRTNTCAVD